jgi:mycofactocin precursor
MADPTPPVEAVDAAGDEEAELVETELLIEDLSIDGMCGVY